MGFGLVDFPPLILQRPLIIAGLLQKADRLAGVVALMKFFTNGEWVDAVKGNPSGFDQYGVVFVSGFDIKN